MATLSQFFGDAVASGQSEYVTDPRKMFWAVPYLIYTKGRRQSSYHTGQSNFWDYNLVYCNRNTTSTDIAYPLGTTIEADTNYDPAYRMDPALKTGNQIQLTDADLGNWVELANVSGQSGFISSIVGPGQYDYVGTDAYTGIKLILDGVEYVVETQIANYNNSTTVGYQRLCFNLFSGSGEANVGYHPQFHGYYDYGTEQVDYTTWSYGYSNTNILYTGQYMFIANPYSAGISTPGLRFENSFQIYVKNFGGPTTQSTTNFSDYAGAYWKYDMIVPGF